MTRFEEELVELDGPTGRCSSTAAVDVACRLARLRDPDGGCPWDLQQDFGSIAPYTLEEAYEVVDAIETNDATALRDELGLTEPLPLEAGVARLPDAPGLGIEVCYSPVIE